MTAVTDVKTIIGLVKSGAEPTNEQLSRLGAEFKDADPYGQGSYADPDNPTNEEMAQNISDNIWAWLKDTVRRNAEKDERKSLESTVTAAGDTAVADLE